MSNKIKVFAMMIAVGLSLSLGVISAYALTNSNFTIEGSIKFKSQVIPLDTDYPFIFTKTDDGGVSFSTNPKTLISYIQSNNGKIVIPERVKLTKIDGETYYITGIGAYSFMGTRLTNITMPDSVTSIGIGAFEGCQELTSINIPQGVANIVTDAFRGCIALTSITISNNVTSIETGAFYNCTKISDVYYAGTESQWNAISISEGNDCLTGANIHFN